VVQRPPHARLRRRQRAQVAHVARHVALVV
jgi:hypothetical protein